MSDELRTAADERRRRYTPVPLDVYGAAFREGAVRANWLEEDTPEGQALVGVDGEGNVYLDAQVEGAAREMGFYAELSTDDALALADALVMAAEHADTTDTA